MFLFLKTPRHLQSNIVGVKVLLNYLCINKVKNWESNLMLLQFLTGNQQQTVWGERGAHTLCFRRITSCDYVAVQ